MSNSDPFNPITNNPQAAPVARGRRDPELRSQLEAETDSDQLLEPGDADQAFYGLVPGDAVVAKVSIAGQTAMGEAWFTYGGTTHLLEGESEEEAFLRLADVVNTRVIDLARDATTRVNGLVEEQRAELRSSRIQPR